MTRRGPRYQSEALRARERIRAKPRWMWRAEVELWLAENVRPCPMVGLWKLRELVVRYWKRPQSFRQ